VKNLIRRIDLDEAKPVIDEARGNGAQSVRPAVMDWLATLG
jgi:phosphotransferase system enzyme I (PtsP)